MLGTVVETSQVVAIPHTSSSINTYTYLHVPIIYLSLPRYLVRYLVILQQHRRHKITQQKAPTNPKRKERKKKEKKKAITIHQVHEEGPKVPDSGRDSRGHPPSPSHPMLTTLFPHQSRTSVPPLGKFNAKNISTPEMAMPHERPALST